MATTQISDAWCNAALLIPCRTRPHSSHQCDPSHCKLVMLGLCFCGEVSSRGAIVKTTIQTIVALEGELQFLEKGGYRQEAFGVPLIFEDSPVCARSKCCSCSSSCALMQFVPRQFQSEPSPCRYIPLDEINRTVDDFYRTG